ncbi:MAG: formate--tetrahydrofolate ligase, partial [Ruthenibacterium sp.]
MKSDIQIAQEAVMQPVCEIADALGLAQDTLIPYGRYKAKVDH